MLHHLKYIIEYSEIYFQVNLTESKKERRERKISSFLPYTIYGWLYLRWKIMLNMNYAPFIILHFTSYQSKEAEKSAYCLCVWHCSTYIIFCITQNIICFFTMSSLFLILFRWKIPFHIQSNACWHNFFAFFYNNDVQLLFKWNYLCHKA